MPYSRRREGEVMDDIPIVNSLQVRGHTPGRWSVGRDGIPIGCVDLNVVAKVYRKTINANHVIATIRHGSDQWEANANLIAAAPELLAALKDLMHWSHCQCLATSGRCEYCVATDAINKAEGKVK